MRVLPDALRKVRGLSRESESRVAGTQQGTGELCGLESKEVGGWGSSLALLADTAPRRASSLSNQLGERRCEGH